MEEVIIKMSMETMIIFGLPLAGVAVFVARYFWKKEKCFALMKTKIEELSESESGSDKLHDSYGNRLTALETKMNLLLHHFKIKSE